MIKVIGKTGCNRCTMTKNILTNKNVEFEYLLFEDLSSDEQNKYMKLVEEQTMIELPLIIKNDKLITLQEI